MAIKSGRPSTKEKALEAVKVVDSPAVKMQRFNVDLPEQLHSCMLHKAMKIQAALEGLKLNNLTVKIFNEYLSKNSNN
jgi:hypothetical protein